MSRSPGPCGVPGACTLSSLTSPTEGWLGGHPQVPRSLEHLPDPPRVPAHDPDLLRTIRRSIIDAKQA